MNRREFLERGLLLPLAFLPACGGREEASLRLAFPALGTAARLLLLGPSRELLREAGRAAREAFRRGEALLSPFRSDSALSRLLREAGRRACRVDPVLGEFLAVSRRAWEATGRAFDPSVAPLLRAYALNSGGRIPPPEELLEARSRVGLERIEWDPAEGKVRFPFSGFALDPCGAGKGLVLDLAARAAREAGARAGLLEAGGDLRAFGPRTFLTALRVKGVPGGVVRLLPFREGGLAASGLLERPLRAGGRLLGHVADPRTGRILDPEDRNVPLTAAALAPTGALADALATGLLVLGREGLSLVERIAGAEGLLVFRGEGKDFRLAGTPGFPRFSRGQLFSSEAFRKAKAAW